MPNRQEMNTIDELASAMEHDSWLNSEHNVSVYKPKRVKVSLVEPAEYPNAIHMFETTEDFLQDALHESLMDELVGKYVG